MDTNEINSTPSNESKNKIVISVLIATILTILAVNMWTRICSVMVIALGTDYLVGMNTAYSIYNTIGMICLILETIIVLIGALLTNRFKKIPFVLVQLIIMIAFTFISVMVNTNMIETWNVPDEIEAVVKIILTGYGIAFPVLLTALTVIGHNRKTQIGGFFLQLVMAVVFLVLTWVCLGLFINVFNMGINGLIYAAGVASGIVLVVGIVFSMVAKKKRVEE